ncbi:MAG: hypothetical protein QM820_59055 [Minicystis sp.]
MSLPRILEGALGVADDLGLAPVLHLEEELLHALLLVDLEEALLRARALVLHRLAVHVAEDQLEELPGPVEIAPVDAAHAHHGIVFVLRARGGCALLGDLGLAHRRAPSLTRDAGDRA